MVRFSQKITLPRKFQFPAGRSWLNLAKRGHLLLRSTHFYIFLGRLPYSSFMRLVIIGNKLLIIDFIK